MMALVSVIQFSCCVILSDETITRSGVDEEEPL
jgi:hypothetical protein